MESISFTKVALPYGWLGNMSPYPILYNGKIWRTTEALFQALRFNNEEIQEAIRAEKSPMGAKFKAKGNKECMIVEQLSAEDIENMRLCVRLKLEQHPELWTPLLETGDLPIYEDVTARGARGSNLFWGALRKEDGTWEGNNYLGKIWMEERAKLKSKVSKDISS